MKKYFGVFLINTNISFIAPPPPNEMLRKICILIMSDMYFFFHFVFGFVKFILMVKIAVIFTYFFQGPGNSFAAEFLGFAIYVSNTTEKDDGILCFKDTNSTVNDISPVFNITCPVHGQYVIYYNERKGPMDTSRSMSEYAFNDLCEVEVYGNFLSFVIFSFFFLLISISIQMVNSEYSSYKPLCS